MTMLNFDTLPTTGGFSMPEEGWHKAVISECKMGKTQDGRDKLELEYKLASGGLVKFDNIVVTTKEGNALNFGLYKLRQLLIATGVVVTGNAQLSIIPTLVKGKALEVKVQHTEPNAAGKVYCQIDGAEFAPVGTNIHAPVSADVPFTFGEVSEVTPAAAINIEDQFTI